MENRMMNDERWAEEQLRALDPRNDWHPNAAAALAGLQRRDRRRRTWERGWILSTAMASAGAVLMIAIPASAKCALVGIGWPRPTAVSVLLSRASAASPAPRQPVAAAKASAPAPLVNYKETGSPSAPVVCEIYSDYECPSCASFYATVFPQFVSEFVKTGKVRVVHRDFPLPQHPFAKLAARYANAAGEMGHFEEVEKQLFASQPEWAINGNVDAAVAHVLTAETMEEVRALVENGPQLDATVAGDLLMVAWTCRAF
jgi:protein-disulfide isomerase